MGAIRRRVRRQAKAQRDAMDRAKRGLPQPLLDDLDDEESVDVSATLSDAALAQFGLVARRS